MPDRQCFISCLRKFSSCFVVGSIHQRVMLTWSGMTAVQEAAGGLCFASNLIQIIALTLQNEVDRQCVFQSVRAVHQYADLIVEIEFAEPPVR